MLIPKLSMNLGQGYRFLSNQKKSECCATLKLRYTSLWNLCFVCMSEVWPSKAVSSGALTWVLASSCSVYSFPLLLLSLDGLCQSKTLQWTVIQDKILYNLLTNSNNAETFFCQNDNWISLGVYNACLPEISSRQAKTVRTQQADPPVLWIDSPL